MSEWERAAPGRYMRRVAGRVDRLQHHGDHHRWFVFLGPELVGEAELLKDARRLADRVGAEQDA